ncbi:hypothetical protein GCM10022251_77620 [Phytohabitans flavus]
MGSHADAAARSCCVPAVCASPQQFNSPVARYCSTRSPTSSGRKYEVAHKKVSQGLGEIRQILGEAIDVSRVSADDVRKAFQGRLDELDDLAVEIKASDEDHVRAGKMVLAMESPNSRVSQQYKDSLLWRLVVRAAAFNEVYFVTEDAAFYDKSKALAPNLLREAEDAECAITAFHKVEDLLNHFEAGKPEALETYSIDVFQDYTKQALWDVVGEYGSFQVGGCEDFKVFRFLTDNPHASSLSASFEFKLVEPGWGEYSDPIGLVSGTVSAEMNDRDGGEGIYNVQIEHISIIGITPHQDIEIAKVDLRSAGAATVPTSIRRWSFKKEIQDQHR